MATFDLIFEKEMDGLINSVHGGAQQNPTGLKNSTEASEMHQGTPGLFRPPIRFPTVLIPIVVLVSKSNEV